MEGSENHGEAAVPTTAMGRLEAAVAEAFRAVRRAGNVAEGPMPGVPIMRLGRARRFLADAEGSMGDAVRALRAK